MKLWKIFVLLLVGISFWSCNDDDNHVNYRYVVSPIDSINMPDSARIGQRVPIITYTTQLENCQQFELFDYQAIGNERTVATWLLEFDNENCGNRVVITPRFHFEPMHPGLFHFRFYAGQDIETEEDIFITKDIVVQ